MSPIRIHPLIRPVAIAVLSAAALPALADCPPLGTLPGFQLEDDGGNRLFGEHTFLVGNEESYEEKVIRGPYCHATFIHSGDGMSRVEILHNYRDQIAKLGGEVTYRDRNNLHGRLRKDGKETWVFVYAEEQRIDQVVVTQAPHKPRLISGAGDHRLFGHMPGYALDGGGERRNFDEASFAVGPEGEEVTVEGAKFLGRYFRQEGSSPASIADTLENYRHALLSRGGEVVHADRASINGRLLDGNTVVWLRAYAEEEVYELTVIEEKPFQSSLQAPKANELREALDKNGRVALYVNFDFGKATLRPDAQPVLAQVVELLKADPALKLTVEGHTDDVGSDEANLKLSTDRAAAVVDALAAKGIARDRLDSAGYGESRPIADNTSSEGRARNRRVELVKR